MPCGRDRIDSLPALEREWRADPAALPDGPEPQPLPGRREPRPGGDLDAALVRRGPAVARSPAALNAPKTKANAPTKRRGETAQKRRTNAMPASLRATGVDRHRVRLR